jgi:hypothetical protein
MNQLVQEHKSLWRIQNDYMGDAGDCGECSEFWKKMEKDKQDHINEIMGMIESHFDKMGE